MKTIKKCLPAYEEIPRYRNPQSSNCTQETPLGYCLLRVADEWVEGIWLAPFPLLFASEQVQAGWEGAKSRLETWKGRS